MGYGSQAATSLLPQALDFAEECCLLTDQAQSKQNRMNLAALFWIPVVSTDSHVQEILVGVVLPLTYYLQEHNSIRNSTWFPSTGKTRTYWRDSSNGPQ